MLDRQMEIENRIRNLAWTVSGDYSLEMKPDVEAFLKDKNIALYDAIKQGAFAYYYNMNDLSLYLMKKMYCGAEEGPLMSIAQLCVDAAVYPKIVKERPGVKKVRTDAFEALLDHDYARMAQSFPGRVKIAVIREYLYQNGGGEKSISDVVKALDALGESQETMDIIRAVDHIYNTGQDGSFERRHGDLEAVLSVELEELMESGWQEVFQKEMMEELLAEYLEEIGRQTTSMTSSMEKEETQEKNGPGKQRVLVIDDEAIAKMQSYMELNFGRGYLSEAESKKITQRLCRGAHADCSLYYTEGILENPVLSNAQYVNAKRQAQFNRKLYQNSSNTVRHNIEIMTDSLKRSLILRTQNEEVPSEYGRIVPNRLWRVGRTDPGKLFERMIRQDSTDFVVEILIDASGSQRDRQTMVALQAVIISQALSNVQIPHRVMSFCTFWDYTVMQRFRDYDDPREADMKILNYTTSANNRDGLAIRAAGDSLKQRMEENKILIVLSDGRPNDIVVNRPGSRNPNPYFGDYAVKDTAQEIRMLRNEGIYILGVFAGLEQDLEAEKKIFGKDFAYIRDIRNFSNVVSKYLQRLLKD